MAQMASFVWLCLATLMVYPMTSIAYPSYSFIPGGHYPVHSFDSLLDATKALVDPLLLGASRLPHDCDLLRTQLQNLFIKINGYGQVTVSSACRIRKTAPALHSQRPQMEPDAMPVRPTARHSH